MDNPWKMPLKAVLKIRIYIASTQETATWKSSHDSQAMSSHVQVMFNWTQVTCHIVDELICNDQRTVFPGSQ